MLKDKGYAEFVNELTSEEVDTLHKKLQRGGIVGSDEFVRRVKREAANNQSQAPEQGPVGKQPKYKLFIIAGSYLLIFIVGLSGIYFYLKAISLGDISEIQQMVTGKFNKVRGLDDTEWEVKLTPISGGGQIADTISFIQGKFFSGRLNTSGYLASNYSLTIEDSGKIIWETMQTGSDGTASWRGEIDGDKMQGILSLRSQDGQTQDFSFMSIMYRRKE